MPVHNAADCAIEAIRRAKLSLNAAGADWQMLIVDDWSRPEEHEKLRAAVEGNTRISLGTSQALGFGPNPNLGRILNYALDSMPEDCGWFWHIESDVMAHEDTLGKLLEGLCRVPDAPLAVPMQFSPDGRADFIFWGAGIVTKEQLSTVRQLQPLMFPQRPRWTNLGCVLLRGNVARDSRCRGDEQFQLFCTDGDWSATVAQHHGRPLYWPEAVVTHLGRQSTREGQPDGYTAHDAVRRFDTKWAGYLAGGLFGP